MVNEYEGSEIAATGPLGGSVVRNNIVVGHSTWPSIFCQATTFAKPTFATNDVWNTETGGRYGGNCSVGDAPTDLNIDPVFADPDWDDVHLRADSPLIDAGTADAGVAMDIDGDAFPTATRAAARRSTSAPTRPRTRC